MDKHSRELAKHRSGYWLQSIRDIAIVASELENTTPLLFSLSSLMSTSTITNAELSALQQSASAASFPIPVCLAPGAAYTLCDNQDDKTGNKKFFVPYLLSALVHENGKVVPDREYALPWLLRCVLEPTDASLVVVLGDADKFDSYFAVNIPDWITRHQTPTIKQLTEYTECMLCAVTKDNWKQQLQQLNFSYMAQTDKIAVYPMDSIVKGSTVWLEKFYRSFLGDKTVPISATSFPFFYGSQLSKSSLNEKKTLKDNKIAHISSQYQLSDSQLQALRQSLNMHSGGLLPIKAVAGSGKTAVINELVANLWAQAALDKRPPPFICYLAHGDTDHIHLSSIFDCMPAGSSWLTASCRQRYVQDPFADTVNLGVLASKFLTECGGYFQQEIDNLSQAQDILWRALEENYQILQEGKKYFRQLAAMENKIIAKYGTLLQFDYKWQETEHRIVNVTKEVEHIKLLYNLWDRQIDLLPLWSKILKFVPSMRKKRLQTIYMMLEEYFADQDLSSLSVSAIRKHLAQQISSREQQLADSINLKSALQDLQSCRDAALCNCKEWAKQYLPAALDDLQNIRYYQETILENKIFHLAYHYWEAFFLQKFGCENHQAMLSMSFPKQPFSWIDKNSFRCDWLIVERAETVSSMLGIGLLAKFKRVVLFGNENIPLSLQIPVQADYYQALHCKIAEIDEDFENLASDGLLASSGNLFKMSHMLVANSKESINFATQWQHASEIVDLQNNFGDSITIKANNKANTRLLAWPAIGYKYIASISEPSRGSKINLGEVHEIIDYLEKNYREITQKYQTTTLSDVVGIVTTFSQQRAQFLQIFAEHPKLCCGVELLPKTILWHPKPIIIFSPVYCEQDLRPFCFDKGCAMLKQLVSLAKHHLLVFGDFPIFDVKHNSASGKFAEKLLEQIN